MIEYSLKRAERKTISITVKPDLTVEVRSPFWLSKKQIDEFVCSKKDWIERKIENFKALSQESKATDFSFDGYCLLLGEEEPIKELIEQDGNVKEELTKFYKKFAKRYFQARLDEIAKKAEINYSALTVTSAKTRWGSCRGDRISLSYHLIMAEPSAVDYVITHELCHIIHPNHSRAFWGEVQRLCPNYTEEKARLKKLAPRIKEW